MDEWLEKYRREYESLPPLASIPEFEREYEFHRREEIRKALYALPDAPRPSELSDLEKIVQCAKDDLIASWINEAWCPEDQTLLHTWWLVHDFAGEYRPEFNDKTLARKSANLEILRKKQSNSGAFQSDGVFRDAKMVIWGGRTFELLTPGQLRVIEVLYDRFTQGRPDVLNSDICRLAKVQDRGGFRQNVFKLNRKSGPKMHPVECIVVQTTLNSHRLIDPTKVPKSS